MADPGTASGLFNAMPRRHCIGSSVHRMHLNPEPWTEYVVT